MPTYVYACDTCGKQFEQFQSIKDEPLTVCVCGQEGGVRRVFQPVGIVFKGSGWYITDSRKSDTAAVSGKESASSDGGTASTSESTASTSETSSTSSDAGAASTSETSSTSSDAGTASTSKTSSTAAKSAA